jgi:hypothetical protein
MKFLHLRRIPQEVTTSFRQIRMETCQALLPILKAHKKNKIQRFVTGDESWFILEFHYSAKWTVLRDDVPQKGGNESGRKHSC